MNTTNFKYFMAIVEENSISAAARKLYISQQALSEQLKKMESEVGTPLIHRNPFRLTEAGECFYEYSKRLYGLYDEMMSEIEDITKKRRSKLTIAVATYGTPPYLVDFLGVFQAKYPEYEIAIVKRQHSDIAHNMSGVDLYLSYLPLSPELENYILLDSDPYHVTFQRSLAEKTYGARWESIEEQLIQTQDLSLLREMPFLLLRDRYSQVTQDLQAIFDEYHFKPIVSFNSENSEMNNQVCYNGLGCLLASESFIARRFYDNHNLDTQELLSYPIRVTSFECKTAVSYEKGKHLHAAEKRFIKELTDYIQKH